MKCFTSQKKSKLIEFENCVWQFICEIICVNQKQVYLQKSGDDAFGITELKIEDDVLYRSVPSERCNRC